MQITVISPDEGVKKTDKHVLPDSFLETAIGSERTEQIWQRQ